MYGVWAYIALAVAAPFALAVALSDLRRMEIPNWLNGAAAAAFAVLVLIALPLDAALWRLAGGLIVLAVSVLLFMAGVIGGGDGKAAAAFAILVAAQDAPFVLLLLSVSALVGIGVLAVLRRTRLADGPWEVWRARGQFPYGVALGATLLIYLALVAFLME